MGTWVGLGRDRAWVVVGCIASTLAACAEAPERSGDPAVDATVPFNGDQDVGTGGTAMPPGGGGGGAMATVDAAIDGCRPNPDNEQCPEICPEACNEFDDDCDGEVDEEAELTDCAFDHATSICSAGLCILTGCDNGFRDCDGDSANGCEADITSVDACGGCGSVCAYDNTVAQCVDGSCEPAGCVEPYIDCDGEDGLCETFAETLLDCGGCGVACGDPDRATPACVEGACIVDECLGNYGDCNDDIADGCELQLNVNDHCGGCGMGCAFAGSLTSCTSGTCVIEACAPGYADCDGSAITACDDLASDGHCGGCGRACTVDALDNVSAAGCVDRDCETTCEPLFGDCDGDPGCETPLTSVNNCGSCGGVCSPPHAVGVCDDGSCGVGGCDQGWADCDGDPQNGCETDTGRPDNCGGCGIQCQLVPDPIGCDGDICTGIVCPEGLADCDGVDQCEYDLSTDATCGGCNVGCAFDQNVDGHGSVACAVEDPTPGQRAWACEVSCDDGFADCDGDYRNGCEADLTELSTCGGCGSVCSKQHGTATCENRVCEVATCDTDWGDCDGDELSCETQLNSADDCGSCGVQCDFPFAAALCGGSPGARQCTISACLPSEYANCNGDTGDGCEVDTTSDPAHCNGCGNDCAGRPNVFSAACSGSACIFTCDTGYDDCDGGAGCETSLVHVESCGSCGNDCNALPEVMTSACLPGGGNPVCAVVSCNPGRGDCNGDVGDGCEVNTDTSDAHCGGCSGDPGHEPCSGLTNVQSSTCSAGSCQIAICQGGYEDCNGVAADGCEWDPNVDGQCCDPGADQDGDGSDDCADGCPSDPDKSAPGVCGCFVTDADTDGDGALDCEEDCDLDPNKTAPGTCGCDVADVDGDGDGFLVCQESCDGDVDKQDPGVCGCGTPDDDGDGDGIEDCIDGCPDHADPSGACPAKRIVVDPDFVDCTLTSFPVLVQIAGDSELMTARDDGADVFFSTSDSGPADLDFEVESWDRAAGDLTAWVRLPSISSSQDTVFHLQYGDGSSNDKQNVGGVWQNGHAAVFHMDYGGGPGTEPDSTSNDNDLIPYYDYSQPRDTGGRIGRGLDFANPGDMLSRTDSASLDITTAVTMSAWVKPNAGGSPIQWETIVAKRFWSGSGLDYVTNYELAVDNGVALNTRVVNYFDGELAPTGRSLAPAEGSWLHLALVVTGGTCAVYEDGVQTASNIPGCALTPNDGAFYVGGYDGYTDPTWPSFGVNYDQAFYGSLDEVRVSAAARNACWIRASYESQRSGSTFVTIN